MNSKEFLQTKGVYSLDTKKRTEQVISWLDEYRSQGEQEAREKVIWELVGWMEEEELLIKFYKAISGVKVNNTDNMFAVPKKAAKKCALIVREYAQSLLKQEGEDPHKKTG